MNLLKTPLKGCGESCPEEVPLPAAPMMEMPKEVHYGKVPSIGAPLQSSHRQLAWGSNSCGGALLATLCYEAAHRKVLCAANHWALQETRVLVNAHARVHTHTHCRRPMGDTHCRRPMGGLHQEQEEKLLLLAMPPQHPLLTKLSIVFTIMGKLVLKGSAETMNW